MEARGFGFGPAPPVYGSIVPQQSESKMATKISIYDFITENLKLILPVQIRSNKNLFDTFVDIFMNEVQTTEEHRQMFAERIKTSLDELIFTYRTALVLELDRHEGKFNQIYYREIYDKIFRSSNYKLAFVSHDKLINMDHEIDYTYKKSVNDEIEYLVGEFKKYVSKHPGYMRMSCRTSKDGTPYGQHSKVFVDDIVKTKVSRFTFEFKIVKGKDGVDNAYIIVVRT